MTRDGGLREESVMETVEAHVGKMEAELKQWGARLDNLQAMADIAGTAARIDYRQRLENLREKYLTAEKRFAELKAAGNAKWETLQGAVEAAWSELETAFTKLAN
jgi:hypothetical protein